MSSAVLHLMPEGERLDLRLRFLLGCISHRKPFKQTDRFHSSRPSPKRVQHALSYPKAGQRANIDGNCYNRGSFLPSFANEKGARVMRKVTIPHHVVEKGQGGLSCHAALSLDGLCYLIWSKYERLFDYQIELREPGEKTCRT